MCIVDTSCAAAGLCGCVAVNICTSRGRDVTRPRVLPSGCVQCRGPAVVRRLSRRIYSRGSPVIVSATHVPGGRVPLRRPCHRRVGSSHAGRGPSAVCIARGDERWILSGPSRWSGERRLPCCLPICSQRFLPSRSHGVRCYIAVRGSTRGIRVAQQR